MKCFSFGIEKLNKTGEVQTEMLRFDRLILAPDLYCSKSEVFGMAWTQSLGLIEAPTPYRDTFASKSQDPTTTNHSRPTRYRFHKGSQFWSQTMAQPSTTRLELSQALLTLRRAQSLNVQVRASHVGMQDDEACRAESFGFALSFGFGSVNPGYMILWWWSDMI